MKYVLIIINCMLLASCNNGGNRSTNYVKQEQQENQSADWQITTKVKASIMADGSLSAASRFVSVTTQNGVVTISGTVASKDDMNQIIRLSQDVDGVRRINNRMTVSKS